MRKKSAGKVVCVPIPFVPAGGCGVDLAAVGCLRAGEGIVAFDAIGLRCPVERLLPPIALAIPIPRLDCVPPLLLYACRSSSAAS